MLSVVIPAYGPSPYLTESIRSAIKAFPLSVPIIIIDDGTKNNDVKNQCNSFMPRVQYLKKSDNEGMSKTFTDAFSVAANDYVVICGSDDVFLPNFYTELKKSLAKHPGVDCLQMNVEVINSEGIQFRSLTDRVKSFLGKFVYSNSKNNLLHTLALGNFTYFPSLVWRCETGAKHGFDLSLGYAQDLKLLFNFCLKGEKFFFDKNSVVCFQYRRHEESASTQLSASINRISSEFKVHYDTSKEFQWRENISGNLLLHLAMTIRLNASRLAFLSMKDRNFSQSQKLFRLSFSSLRSIEKFFENE